MAINKITGISYYLKLEAALDADEDTLVAYYETVDNSVLIAKKQVIDDKEYYYCEEPYYKVLVDEPEKHSEFNLFEVVFQSMFKINKYFKKQIII